MHLPVARYGMTKLILALALVVMVVVSILPQPVYASPGPGWYNASWKYRRLIAIDHTQVDDVADPSTTYTNFPVLIYATGLSNIKANGADIRFTGADGTTELPRQIESYSGGTLWAWVKVTLTKDSSDATNNTIYMYYGNSAATEPAANSAYGSQNVWNTNFVGVWHLNESSGNKTYDSTSNSNTGNTTELEGIPKVTLGVAGQVNSAAEFDGNLGRIDVADSASLDLSTNGTLEAWIYPRSFLGFDGIIHKGDMGDFSDEAYSLQLGEPYGDVWLSISDGTNTTLQLPFAINTSEWSHVVGAWDSSGMYIYIDGVATSIPNTLTVRNTSGEVNIGAQTDYATETGTNLPFDGTIDEVRISNTARSAAWIATEYNNQSSLFPFYAVGVENNNTWNSYDSDYSTPRETYDIGHKTVYMNGTDFPNISYLVAYYDADGTKRSSETKSASVGVLQSAYDLSSNPTAAAGTWHTLVQPSSGYTPFGINSYATITASPETYGLLADDSYTVEAPAIPEFPTVFAAIGVAGLCFGIYYWMRRRLAYVKA